ncbi:MAG TPA: gamma-glutamyltransferase family protein, partial [Thermoanaerobaculia bacterium]|nr:gamma-glutamyltransferase family protein [Thermoanaerobaculia bacterium]
MKRPAAFFLLLVALLFPGGPLPAAFEPAPIGRGGAVAANDRRAAAVGLEILKSGGNAVDAAIGTALALAVVFPEAGNLAGGGFAVLRQKGAFAALDFREVAPAAASRDMYLDEKGEAKKGASTVGPLAAGTPGSPAGLWELHKKYGKLPWARLVEPAERLAREGFTVDRHLHDRLIHPDQKRLAQFPETAALWRVGAEQPLAIGALIQQPALARTLAAYRDQGPEGITRGAVAGAVEAASLRHGGVLTAADLAGYRPVWREPLRFSAFGWQLATMPLPSSGGMILGQTFGQLERLAWPKLPRFGADRAHLLAEALRRSFADRYLLGDPSTTQADAAQLLDSAWLARRAASIDRGKVSPSKGVFPWPGDAPPAEKPETTHISVIDADGNLIALTTTLNDLFGCGLYVPEIGFLNNEMDDFATAPGRPNLFGLIQGEANAVAPGKKMLSSMAPTLAWRVLPEGEEAIAIGGRGGSRIPTHVAQVLLNVMVDGDSLAEAL